ncbi:MAG: transporter substrate-binding domain-containing protein [Desulfamplus sp.]|nr:transporter substrate-binding domain-containing protein [Desulfamplus sp.]
MKKLSFKQIFSNITSLCVSFTFLLIAFLFIGSTVYAQEKIVSVATLDDYSPYCFPKSSKKSFKELIPPGSDSVNLQGYSWDILRESFHIQGYTIRLTVYPWKRAVYDTKTGAEDVIFPTIKNPQREGDFYFSKESVDQVNFLVYVPLDSTIEWSGLSSLEGLTIGQIAGWDLGKTWSGNGKIKKDSITKIIQGFKMLDMKRIDGFAGYEINFDYALKSERWQTQYKKLPSFDASIEYVAGAKTNLKIPSILNDFDLGKRKIIENKTFELISKKWGVNSFVGNK